MNRRAAAPEEGTSAVRTSHTPCRPSPADMRRLLPLLPLVLSACRSATPPEAGEGPGQRACTMEFRTYGTTLVDAQARPVTGARVDVRRADGTSILCRSDDARGCLRPADVTGYGAPGTYTLMTDGVQVSTAGETFAAMLTAPDGRAAAGTFRFSNDGCHVRKLSGPDTLRLR